MALTTVELTPRIGTEIRTDIETLVSGRHAAQIRELLQQRGVLVLRGLHLDKDQQLAFSHTLGKVQPQGEGGIFKISIDPKESPGASTGGPRGGTRTTSPHSCGSMSIGG